MLKHLVYLFVLISNCYSMDEKPKDDITCNKTNCGFITVNGESAPDPISQVKLNNNKININQISKVESFQIENLHLENEKIIKLKDKNSILHSKIEKLSNKMVNIQQILSKQIENQNLRNELKILLQEQPDFDKIKSLINDTNIDNKDNKMENILSNFNDNLNNSFNDILKQFNNFKAEECNKYNYLLENISKEIESLKKYWQQIKSVLPEFYKDSYLEKEIQYLIDSIEDMENNIIKYTKKLNELNFERFINKSKNKINTLIKEIEDEFNNKYKIFNDNKIDLNEYNRNLSTLKDKWENLKNSESILKYNEKEK